MSFISTPFKWLFSLLPDVDWASITVLKPFLSKDPVTGKIVGTAAPSSIAQGTAVGQTARWDGTAWKPTGNVKIDAQGNVSFLDNGGHELLRFAPSTAAISLLHSFLDGVAGTTLTGDGLITTSTINAFSITVSQYGAMAVGLFGSYQFKNGSGVLTSSIVQASPGVLRVLGPNGSAGSLSSNALYIDSGSITSATSGTMGTVIGKAPVRDEYQNLKGYVAIYG